ncbi:MAG: SDR family oxidoreductase [Candidatus Kapaibacterium sp.]
MGHKVRPEQHQETQPGYDKDMIPRPSYKAENYKGSGKLKGKKALITGGDSGIGRAVAILFAREGADIGIMYLDEHEDAEETKQYVRAENGGGFIAMDGDVADDIFCRNAVDYFIETYGKIDILVNNAGVQHPQRNFEDISRTQLERTFASNIFSQFYLSQAALPYMEKGSVIINTTSVTAYRGSPGLIDYSATKGAITSFTRSLALHLAERGIRVNGVAPGPIWTPLIPASFDEEYVSQFGSDQPLGRVGQPDEVAPAYVYLASTDSSYVTGQVIHPNGGEIING